MNKNEFKRSTAQVIEESSKRYCPDEYEKLLEKQKEDFSDRFLF